MSSRETNININIPPSPPNVKKLTNILCSSLNIDIGKQDYQDNTYISGFLEITINIIITFYFPKGIVHFIKYTHNTSIFKIKNTIEHMLMFTGLFTYLKINIFTLVYVFRITTQPILFCQVVTQRVSSEQNNSILNMYKSLLNPGFTLNFVIFFNSFHFNIIKISNWPSSKECVVKMETFKINIILYISNQIAG